MWVFPLSTPALCIKYSTRLLRNMLHHLMLLEQYLLHELIIRVGTRVVRSSHLTLQDFRAWAQALSCSIYTTAFEATWRSDKLSFHIPWILILRHCIPWLEWFKISKLATLLRQWHNFLVVIRLIWVVDKANDAQNLGHRMVSHEPEQATGIGAVVSIQTSVWSTGLDKI